MNAATAVALTVAGATIAVGLLAGAVGWVIAHALMALHEAASTALRRRLIHRRAADAVAAALRDAAEHGGDMLAAAMLIIGGLYAIGGGLLADARHAALLIP